MDLKTLIKPERVVLLPETKKGEVILQMAELAGSTGEEIPDLDQLKKELFFREELMSTGIGQGVAVPHVRLEGLKDTVICIGTQKKGIYDYESLDGQPVTLVLMILVSKDNHREYIRILSQLSGTLIKKKLIEPLSKAETQEDLYQILLEGLDG